MFTAAQINALQSCIEVADPGEDRDESQFITMENAISAVKRMREEHRKIASSTLQALDQWIIDNGLSFVKVDGSEVPKAPFEDFLKATYPYPKPLPDFEEDEDHALAEVVEIEYILTDAKVPKWGDGQKFLTPVERVKELVRLYRGLKNTLDEALNSGNGTYKP